MTIVTCVKVRDGLVLGTDSMTQIQRNGQILRAYQNARKLFQVGQLPMGVMTYGLGNIGPRSIESLMREFSSALTNQVAVNTVGKALFLFMREHYDSHRATLPEDAKLPALGFYLAGYSRGQPFAEEREFLLPRDTAPIEPRPKEAFGASWRGVEGPFLRLSKGYGPVVRWRLQQRGMAEEDISTLLDDLEIDALADAMPVQDAIDYATFVLRTTIGYTTFSSVVPPCGGPLQVVTILPDEGLKWLSKPALRVNSA